MEQRQNNVSSQYRNRSVLMTNNYNNSVLISQLKESISRDCLDTLSTNPNGRLEFFIRKGKLSITHEEVRIPLNSRQPIPNPTTQKGLNRPGIKTLIEMVENILLEMEYIDHGEIQINYMAAADGAYFDGNLVIKKAKHFGFH